MKRFCEDNGLCINQYVKTMMGYRKMTKNQIKRIFAMFCVVTMLFGNLPVAAIAEMADDVQQNIEQQEQQFVTTTTEVEEPSVAVESTTTAESTGQDETGEPVWPDAVLSDEAARSGEADDSD